MESTCNRCGRCCLWLAKPDAWISVSLMDLPPIPPDVRINQNRLYLLSERGKYPPKQVERACDMLVFENGLAVCLVHKLLGVEFKQPECVNYCGGDFC